jgi:hypothetical protein
MKYGRYYLTIIFLLGFSRLAFGEDVIQLEIVNPSVKGQLIEAKIKNLSDKAKDLGFSEVLVYGKKKPIKNSKMVEVSWYKISLKNKNYNLKKPLKSRFNATDKFVEKDVFKARGDRKFLAKEIEDLFNSQNPDLKVLAKEAGKHKLANANQEQDSPSQVEDNVKSDNKPPQDNHDIAVPANADLKSEICVGNDEFSHDFAAGKSYRNKTIYYFDVENKRIDVSVCKKSEEVFIHRQDSGSCPIINDVDANQVIAQSRKYIMVDGIKIYIGNCNPSPYKEIGYKWRGEFYDPSASILADGARDDIYIGSNQGEEIEDGEFEGSTRLSEPYHIENYNKSDKCNDWSSISYNGMDVDLSASNKASIKVDNYVDYRQELPRTTRRCLVTFLDGSCAKWRNLGPSQNSISYYQRCLNYRCPINKASKTPIYQRIDGTKFYDEEQRRESKYTCGTNLDGVEHYYNVKS